jgi:2'-hydroxyisoflavone reductase
LKFRPVDETAADTVAWWSTEPEERRAKLKAGISAEREKEVLAALRSGS